MEQEVLKKRGTASQGEEKKWGQKASGRSRAGRARPAATLDRRQGCCWAGHRRGLPRKQPRPSAQAGEI